MRPWAWILAATIATGAYALGYGLLDGEAARLSLRATTQLGLEVAGICLALAVVPAFLALRRPSRVPAAQLLLIAASTSLLIPTIARSLAFSALFAYYGPLATGLRTLGLWPDGAPLESSHLAVVISLVTLYLPLSLLVLMQGVQQLGRAPEIGETLGAGAWQRLRRILAPGLARPLIAAALIVFSQAMGAIVTPRILGSRDVTLAVLIDDLMKQSLDTGAAMRIAAAELVVVIPVACLAAFFLGTKPIRRLTLPRTKQASLPAVASAAPLAALLFVPPLVVLALSLVNGSILSLGTLAQNGLSLKWYRAVLSEPAWRQVAVPSIAVWLASSVISIIAALLLIERSSVSERARAGLRGFALVLMFIPHNALGVLIFLGLAQLPHGITSTTPAWLLAGMGQAVPVFGLTFIVLEGAQQRAAASMRVAATLGASRGQRIMRIALPQIFPAVTGCLVAAALVSLDDVIFVRYLPAAGLDTYSTEMFSRARYTSSPDLAAACVLLWMFVGVIGGAAPLVRAVQRWAVSRRRPLAGSGAGSEGARVGPAR